MKLTTLEEDLRIHQKLDDEPNDVGGLSAQALKEKFDQAGLTIQKYLNETHLPEDEAAMAETLEAAKAYTDQKVVSVGSGDMAVAVYDTKKRRTDVYEYAEAKANEAKGDTSKLGFACGGTSTLSALNKTVTVGELSELIDPKGLWPENVAGVVAPAGAKAVMVHARILWARQTFGNCYVRLKVNNEVRTTRNGPHLNNGTYYQDTLLMMASVEEGDVVSLELAGEKGSSTSNANAEVRLKDMIVEFVL